MEYQSVTNFYKDSVVLITGGTGFIGKVLIEKLLRCFEVKRIYLLVREKKNAKAKDRLRAIFDEPIFEVIKKCDASALSKVVPIDTDFEQDQIIAEHDRELLLGEVTVVFNVMASVKFNECIGTALNTNVTCSRKLLDMVEKMVHIKSIVHVSTFYSNCDRSCIEERIFDDIPFGGYENILGIFRHIGKHQKEQLTPFILEKMPNSYTFSKKCAEVMIQQRYSHLPIAVFRPPIVISAYREPVPGWVDNFNGIAGMCVPMTQGNVYIARGEPAFPSHSVPVDYCVAALIAVGADRRSGSVPGVGENVPVFNYASETNHVRWGEYSKLIAAGCQSRLGKIFGRYAIGVTNSRIFRYAFVWWFLLQAVIADLLLLLAGKKRRNLRMARRVLALEEAACYFALHKWTLKNDNMRRILNGLNHKERKLLEFDIDRLNWKDYFRNFLPGIRAALDRSAHRSKSFGG